MKLLLLIACTLLSTVTLAQKLKPFDGYFQSPQNKDLVVRFTSTDSLLVAKLMWNNGEMHLVPDTGWSFVSKETGDEGHIHLVFHKDPVTGVADRVNVGGNGEWTRIKDYHPVEKKEMAHTPDQLKRFEGLYQFQEDPTRFVQLMVKGNELVLKQHWDGREIPFVPETELAFFSRQIPQFNLSFTKDPQGNITELLAFGRDRWIKTQNPTLSSAQLQSYEGQFQSADDPDNQIQLVATDKGLKVVQLWDKKEVPLLPLTDTYFNNEALSFPLNIIKDPATGTIKQVKVLGDQLFNKVSR
ncbi:hypothetical protein [Dinghuibacter silviterrae]|uniref:Uncharacterized protein n=1 Tax=Dinghuibacter silviterrae TaxID=1539049 RepID=A0A4R8DH18_9BACT|nr:hypothetical protein [Dinghuibacter silviterrae]TDW96983.1 hypothetical protein EDB95_4819 [Dinghuibacter silviterrae]